VVAIPVVASATAAAVANATAPLRVQPVRSRAERQAFLEFPYRLYADDPAWVPPLRMERREAFADAHPYFRHARWQRWLAWRGDSVVGRISAQVDRLHEERHGDATGHFGLLEAVDDEAVFASLLIVAEQWLADQGMRRVTGPFSLGINQECGLLVDGFATPPRFMMGHARPWHGRHVEACGYRKAVDLFAYECDVRFTPPPLLAVLRRQYGTRLRVRPFDGRRRDADLESMRDIFNDAWANNWGFVPFTREEFTAVGREMTLLFPHDLFQIAELDGEAVAFIVMLPDVNEAIADLGGNLLPFGWARLLWRLRMRRVRTSRVPLMGVRQRYQHTRLGPALAFAVIEAVSEAGQRHGLERAELSWVLEDNAGMNHIARAIGGTQTKRYRLYEKSIADGRTQP
jgi:hypothetical protein